jgi:hypothetical protein
MSVLYLSIVGVLEIIKYKITCDLILLIFFYLFKLQVGFYPMAVILQ